MDAEVRQSLFDDASRGIPHAALRVVLVHKLHGCFGECSDVRNAAHLFTDCSLFSIFYSREEGTLGVEERSLFQPTYLTDWCQRAHQAARTVAKCVKGRPRKPQSGYTQRA